VQIGQSYTISVLTNLDDQGITFKTFEFGNEYDSLQWHVTTRIQYIYDKHVLFKQILVKIDERHNIIEEIIQKYRTQRNNKLSRNNTNNNNKIVINRMSEYVPGNQSVSKTPKSRISSQYAGYYSSVRSVSNSYGKNQHQTQQSFDNHSSFL
jgi:hypothetical protein